MAAANLFSTYLELTKPRALVMIVFTTAISYLIALTEDIDWMILGHTCLGVTLAAAGSLAYNQYMERDFDSRMVRTASRPLPSGRLKPIQVAIFGMGLMIFGYGYLWVLVNPLCSLSTIGCGVSYLWMYTPLKTRSSFSSFVGAIPGGLLPVMGWTAARNELELGAWILFVILWIWQIPHALVISMRHQKDYEAVGMKQLPIISNRLTSNRQILLNVLILIPVSLMPAFVNMTEYVYPLIALLMGFILFIQVSKFATRAAEKDAKRVFIMLSAYLPLLLLAMYFDKPA